MGNENYVWTLPEGHNYAIEFFMENKWIRREEYNTISHLKQVISSGQMMASTLRIVKVSRYPPHPMCEVLYFKEGN